MIKFVDLKEQDKIYKNKILDLWTDKFSKEDVFYTFENNHYYISTLLENLYVNVEKNGYDITKKI